MALVYTTVDANLEKNLCRLPLLWLETQKLGIHQKRLAVWLCPEPLEELKRCPDPFVVRWGMKGEQVCAK